MEPYRSLSTKKTLSKIESPIDANFQEKLKEANHLIEKVRQTLQDLGSGRSPSIKTKHDKQADTLLKDNTISIPGPPQVDEDISQSIKPSSPSKQLTIDPRLREDKSVETDREDNVKALPELKDVETHTSTIFNVDRGSSPIQFSPRPYENEELDLDDFNKSEDADTDSLVTVQSSLIDISSLLIPASTILDKSKHLTIQTLPRVNIPRSLVMQKTLNLNIRSTGSISNDLGMNNNHNIHYEELVHATKTNQQVLKPSDRNINDAMMMLQSYQVVESEESFRSIEKTYRRAQSPRTYVTPRKPIISFPKGQDFRIQSSNIQSPIEIGFYKTKGVQCSSLKHVDSVLLVKKPQISDTSSEITEMAQTVHNLEISSSEISSVIQENKRIAPMEMPVKDVDNLSLSMTQNLNLLQAGDMKEIASDRSSVSKQDDSNKSVNRNAINSVSDDSVSDKEGFSDNAESLVSPKGSNISTLTGSGSSYNIVGYRDEKRPNTEDDESEMKMAPIVVVPESSKEAPTKEKPAVIKVDAEIQVSLASSSDEEEGGSDDDVLDVQQKDSVSEFIKSLTAISRDKLAKMRSIPNFPGSTLQPSSSLLRLHGSNSNIALSNVNMALVDANDEQVQNKTSYDEKVDSESESKIRQTQEHTVLRVSTEMGPWGASLPDANVKRHLPFYTRVLGRIQEPSERSTMHGSRSLDESASEGEVKCMRSVSIGELHPYSPQHATPKNRPLSVSRQRALYNSWMTKYLQRHNTCNDSTSSHTLNSLKKK